MNRTVRIAVLLFVIVSTAVVSNAAAQSPANSTFLAVPERFPDIDARAIVLRQADTDVIVLRSDELTAEILAMSLLVLDRARARPGRAGHGQIIPITGGVLTEPLSSGRRARLELALSELLARPVMDAGTLGPGRWMVHDIH